WTDCPERHITHSLKATQECHQCRILIVVPGIWTRHRVGGHFVGRFARVGVFPNRPELGQQCRQL
ncbi:MAG TPA: hypothetical protein VJX67_24160, partial [Blastocatellia bacterium]|nr:hypothetical protein [Blastocatellia bacterium]